MAYIQGWKLQKEVLVFCSNGTSRNYLDPSKGQKGINKGRSVAFMKKFEVLRDRWLIIVMLFHVEIDSVCVCVVAQNIC